jgi:hypothetical protein
VFAFGAEALGIAPGLERLDALAMLAVGGAAYGVVALPAALWLGDPTLRAALQRVLRIRSRG